MSAIAAKSQFGRGTKVVQAACGTFRKQRTSMRVKCAKQSSQLIPTRNLHTRITGAVLASLLAFTGPVFADGDVLTDDLPKVEEELSSIGNPEQQESAAEQLGVLESEATAADEQAEKGIVDNASNGIKDQLDALKSAFGLQ